MVRFFPSPSDAILSLVVPDTPLAEPAATVPPPGAPIDPAGPTIVAPLEGVYRNHTIPPATMVRVLNLIDKELADLETVLGTLEMRFVGSSVLMVYEGDLVRLDDALEQWESKLSSRDPLAPLSEPESDEDDDSEEEDEEEDDLDGTKEDAKLAKECPPVKVKMIDFAHTWIAEGEGVDEGVLKGLNTLRGLVQGRKRELELLVPK